MASGTMTPTSDDPAPRAVVEVLAADGPQPALVGVAQLRPDGGLKAPQLVWGGDGSGDAALPAVIDAPPGAAFAFFLAPAEGAVAEELEAGAILRVHKGALQLYRTHTALDEGGGETLLRIATPIEAELSPPVSAEEMMVGGSLPLGGGVSVAFAPLPAAEELAEDLLALEDVAFPYPGGASPPQGPDGPDPAAVAEDAPAPAPDAAYVDPDDGAEV